MEAKGILLEAEQFDDWGGWLLDSQFEAQMGSAYLLAHGLGEPVEDAVTTADIGKAGTYGVWVRAKDWVPGYHPGRFQVFVDGTAMPVQLGANDSDWGWQKAGEVELAAERVEVRLHDLTGFDGRCDAVYLAPVGAEPPEKGLDVDRAWRRSLLELPEEPEDGGAYDLVVVGGGVGGAAAAIAAARSGCKVALVSDRPVLGGNASSEVGLGPRGHKTPLVEKMIERMPDDSLGLEAMVATEESIDLFVNARVFACKMEGGRIMSIDMRDLITSRETRLIAPMFVDASGRAALAKLAGADLMKGRESSAEYGESLAPMVADGMHHGNTPLFHVGLADHPVEFGPLPWAEEIAQGFDCLAGQMGALSEDNQPGPCVGEPDGLIAAKAAQAKAGAKLMAGMKRDHMFPPEEVIHLFPGTHFWEYGQFLNMDEPGNEELVRDHLLRALYGTMANVKAAMPEKYANLRFEWIHHVPARGEYERIAGDYVMSEGDIRDHTEFEDFVVMNGDPFCLHFPGDEEHDFRLAKWIYDVRDQQPYQVPFRCLYSRNVSNLMMAGKHVSATHIASSSMKVMANGAQHGIAVGCAAALCKKHGCDPREIGRARVAELREAAESIGNMEA